MIKALFKKATSVILIFMLALSIGVPALTQNVSAASGTTVKFNGGCYYKGSLQYGYWYSVTSPAALKGLAGTCADPFKHVPKAGSCAR